MGEGFLSLPVGEVSRRVENVLQNGFKEVIFTGVDLTSYGEDLQENQN